MNEAMRINNLERDGFKLFDHQYQQRPGTAKFLMYINAEVCDVNRSMNAIDTIYRFLWGKY